jgi:hypothetical protein
MRALLRWTLPPLVFVALLAGYWIAGTAAVLYVRLPVIALLVVVVLVTHRMGWHKSAVELEEERKERTCADAAQTDRDPT